MPTSIEKMCRTCMLNETKRHEAENKNKVKMKVTQMFPIFDVQEEAKEKPNLVELIKATVPQLKIEQNDQLPKHVCLECSEKIKEIYNFQQNCIDIERKFYKMLEKEDTMNPTFNEMEGDDDDDDIFKTEFNDSFIDENSLNSNEEAIMEQEINEAAMAKDEFIDSCSDWSIDLIWDDKSDIGREQKKSQSKFKKNKKTMKSKNELVGDEIYKFKSNVTKCTEPAKGNDSKGIYPCNRCRRKLKSKLSFIKHQKMHEKRAKEKPIFECNICNKAFNDNSILKEHQRSHIGERPFLCSECGKGFTSAGSLKQHSFRHLEEKLFPCPDCPRSFPTKTDMLSHYDIHKAKPRNHICDVCGRGFYKPYLLKQHKMYHNNDRPFACEFCDKRKSKKRIQSNPASNEQIGEEQLTDIKNELKRKKRERAAEYTKKKSTPKKIQQCYPCDKCKRKLKSELSLKKHQEMHDSKDQTYKCNICKEAFNDKPTLKEHTRSHIGEKVFLCSQCGKGYTTAGGLKEHSYRHLNEKNFPCPDCPRSFTTKTDLVSHHIIHKAKPKNHICDICGRGFHKPFLLKKHKMYHNNDRPFACEFCEKRFVTNEKLKRHTRIHTGEKPYKCNYCKNAYCQSSELIKHLRSHLGDNVYQCEMCPLRFKTVKILRLHFSTHKNDDEETKTRNLNELNALEMKGVFFKNTKSAIRNREEFDDEIFETFTYDDDEDVKDDDCVVKEIHSKSTIEKILTSDRQSADSQQLYPCSKCRRKLKSNIALKKHLELHAKRDNEEPKFVCNICDRTFSQSYMLKDHLRTHSGEKPFLCSECGKSFTSSGSLKQHSYRHLNEKPFSCPDCPKQFPTKTDLASHSDVHRARPRTHICDICGRGFPKPFLLKKHKMYHTNDRPFFCEYCGKRFITNEKLQRHVRIHTGEKPYKCNYCEKAYCQSNELTKHLRNHLGDNVYQCELCPLRFPTVKIVREHYSTHKNDDEETKARNLADLNAMELKGIYCR